MRKYAGSAIQTTVNTFQTYGLSSKIVKKKTMSAYTNLCATIESATIVVKDVDHPIDQTRGTPATMIDPSTDDTTIVVVTINKITAEEAMIVTARITIEDQRFNL